MNSDSQSKPNIKAAGPSLPGVIFHRSLPTPGFLFPGLVPIETSVHLAGSEKAPRASSDCSGPSNTPPFSDACAGSMDEVSPNYLPLFVPSLSSPVLPPPHPLRGQPFQETTHTHTWHSEIGMLTMDTGLPFPLRQRLLGISNYL